MKTINKRLKEEELEVLYVFDEASEKGSPTKDSIVLTFVISDKCRNEGYSVDDTEFTIGVALKLPEDEFIPRIGKAIAYRNMKKNEYKTDSIETYDLIVESLRYFEFNGKKLNKKISNRIKNLFYYNFSKHILSTH